MAGGLRIYLTGNEISVYTPIMTERTESARSAEYGSCACFNLRKAARAVTQLFDRNLHPSGLRVTQFSILAVLHRLAPVPVTRLAQALGMDRTTLARDLGPIEREGLVRIGEGADRRKRVVTLTARGRKVFAKAVPLWERAQSRMVEGLGQEKFKELLGQITQAISIAHHGAAARGE